MNRRRSAFFCTQEMAEGENCKNIVASHPVSLRPNTTPIAHYVSAACRRSRGGGMTTALPSSDYARRTSSAPRSCFAFGLRALKQWDIKVSTRTSEAFWSLKRSMILLDACLLLPHLADPPWDDVGMHTYILRTHKHTILRTQHAVACS